MTVTVTVAFSSIPRNVFCIPVSVLVTRGFIRIKFRERKTQTQTNLRDCPGTGWVPKVCLCVIFGHSLWGRKKQINKIPLKSRDNPVKILFMCFSSLFFCSQDICNDGGWDGKKGQRGLPRSARVAIPQPFTGPTSWNFPELPRRLPWKLGVLGPWGQRLENPNRQVWERILAFFGALDGRNRGIVIAESLARVIAAIRIASVRWRSCLPPKHRN